MTGASNLAPEGAKELLRAARDAARNAYAPYSGFAVGAAVQTADGSVFTGANMENTSYGLTVCAEVGALQASSTAGQLANVVGIAIVGAAIEPGRRSKGSITTPCGRCRQLILESAHVGNRDIDVWCADLELTSIRHFKISELLPQGFNLASHRADGAQNRSA
jgi:cytidine deaminase